MSIRILHTADLHLDSPFEALSSGKAAIRRSEQRELLWRIAELAESEKVDVVLLAGDLLDGDNMFYETGEELAGALRRISAEVFISPGNHDYYSARSVYARLKFPPNVHIFTKNEIECFEIPRLRARVFGAAFTDNSSRPLMSGFTARRAEGMVNLMCLHGDVQTKNSQYNAISESDIAASGLDYLALGHVHTASGLKKAGSTYYAWPGCPEGRGFDETGEKFVYIIDLDGTDCRITEHSIAARRYEIMNIDVTGTEPLIAIHTALPEDTITDIYRIVLTGEMETAPDTSRLREKLLDMFFELQLRDETRMRLSIWDKAGENTLRGLFLSKLRDKYDKANDEEKLKLEHAARWGLAALDNMEEIVRHED